MDILHSNQSMGMMGISNFSNQNSNSSGSELHYQHHQNQNPPQLSPKKFYERNQSTDMKMSQQKFMAVYKVNECKKKFNHDKRQCINWHSQADRRRNPFQTAYSTTECDKGLYCRDYIKCSCAHNMLEKMFHPDLFKISRCVRGPNATQCERGEFCAFAHSDEDLRQPPMKSKSVGGSPPSITANTSYTQSLQHGDHFQQRRILPPGGSTHLISKSGPGGLPEGLSPSKPLTAHSVALVNIQRNLVTLIKSQGVDGIISSELPKRFFDHFGVRLDLQDENGEKFRIKDILHNRSDVTVSMHKGVQPKYVYCGPDASLSGRESKVGMGTSPPRPGNVQHMHSEDNSIRSHSSFLAAASGNNSSNSNINESIQHQEVIVGEGNNFNVGNDFMRKHGQPAFSPAGVATVSFFPPSLSSEPTGRSEREEYASSPFFPDSHSAGLSGEKSQDNFSGLLGGSVLDVKNHQQLSNSSVFEDAFKFSFLNENGGDCNDDMLVQDNAQREVYSKQLHEKNIQLDNKSMEVEDLKGKLEEFKLMHRKVCAEYDEEKRKLLTKISSLSETCAALEKEKSSRSQSDAEFPQNAFPMNSTRQPFSPLRSTGSSASSPNSAEAWSSDINRNGRNPTSAHSSSSQFNLGNACGNQCGLHGCTVEGKYLCSGCNIIGYCGPEHQAEHWNLHKNECGMFD